MTDDGIRHAIALAVAERHERHAADAGDDCLARFHRNVARDYRHAARRLARRMDERRTDR